MQHCSVSFAAGGGRYSPRHEDLSAEILAVWAKASGPEFVAAVAAGPSPAVSGPVVLWLVRLVACAYQGTSDEQEQRRLESLLDQQALLG